MASADLLLLSMHDKQVQSTLGLTLRKRGSNSFMWPVLLLLYGKPQASKPTRHLLLRAASPCGLPEMQCPLKWKQSQPLRAHSSWAPSVCETSFSGRQLHPAAHPSPHEDLGVFRSNLIVTMLTCLQRGMLSHEVHGHGLFLMSSSNRTRTL